MKKAHPPSFKSCWQRAIGESDLPSGVRYVLWAISIHFMEEDGGHCFPSIADIMRVTGLSDKPITQHLNHAVETGWLKRWRWGKGRGYRRWNYQAVIPPSGIMENRPDGLPENLREETPDLSENLREETPDLSENLREETPDLSENLREETPDLPENFRDKPWRENITMEREATMHAGAESATVTTEPTPALSEEEKNHRMTKLTDAVIEAAQKTIRQRNVRRDLSDTALNHSIAKCRAQKGYCEMTEAAWIETLVQWVGKERLPNGTASRCETVSRGSPTPSPEETTRQNAAYEARMVAAEAQHQQRLAGYRVAAQHGAEPHAAEDPVQPVDPVRALHALAAKVRMGTTATPASPVQRTFGPMGALPSRRPPLTAERRDALNHVLREMQKAGCSAADLTQIYQGVHDASEDAWPTVIAQARQRLVVPGQAVA
ncbi:MAG: helix-turn-helix domain-containing protein [Candidatus Competibacteraceae bacterium]|nr:helix-turn-helix domain-containing protein [Candidatus Competibacteraceae bacterium]